MVGEGAISWTVGFQGLAQAKAEWLSYRDAVASVTTTSGQAGQAQANVANAMNQVTASMSKTSAEAAKVTAGMNMLFGSMNQGMSSIAKFDASGRMTQGLTSLNTQFSATVASAKSVGPPLANLNTQLNQTGAAAQGAAQKMNGFSSMFASGRGLIFGLMGIATAGIEAVGMLGMLGDAETRVAEAHAHLNQLTQEGVTSGREYVAAQAEVEKAERAVNFTRRLTILSMSDMIPFTLLIINGLQKLRTAQAAASVSNTAMAATSAAASGALTTVGPAAVVAATGVRTLSTAVRGLMIASGIGAGLAIGSLFAEMFMGINDSAQAAKDAVSVNMASVNGELGKNASEAQKWAASIEESASKSTEAFTSFETLAIDSLRRLSAEKQKILMDSALQDKATAEAQKQNAESVRDSLNAEIQRIGQTQGGVTSAANAAAIDELSRSVGVQNAVIFQAEQNWHTADKTIKVFTQSELDAAKGAAVYNDATTLSAATTQLFTAAQAQAAPAIANVANMIRTGQITSLTELNGVIGMVTASWADNAANSTEAVAVNEQAAALLKDAFVGVFQTSKEIQKEFGKTQAEADKLAAGLTALEVTFGVDLPSSIASSEESLKAVGDAMADFSENFFKTIDDLGKAAQDGKDFWKDMKDSMLDKSFKRDLKEDLDVRADVQDFLNQFKIDAELAATFNASNSQIRKFRNNAIKEINQLQKDGNKAIDLFLQPLEDILSDRTIKGPEMLQKAFAWVTDPAIQKAAAALGIDLSQLAAFLKTVATNAASAQAPMQSIAKSWIDMSNRPLTPQDLAKTDRLRRQFAGEKVEPEKFVEGGGGEGGAAVIPPPVKAPNFDTTINDVTTQITNIGKTVIPPMVIPAPNAEEFANVMNTVLLIPADFTKRMNKAFGAAPLVIPAPNTDEFIAGLDLASQVAAGFIETFNNAMGGGGGGGGSGGKKKKKGGGLVIPAPDSADFIAGMLDATIITAAFTAEFTNSMAVVVSTTEEGGKGMAQFAKDTQSNMGKAASHAASASSKIASSFAKIGSAASSAASQVKALASAINSLKDKTVTVTYKQKGSPGGSKQGQHGFKGTVSSPTTFTIGEAGSEDFFVKPTYGSMDREGKMTGNVMGGLLGGIGSRGLSKQDIKEIMDDARERLQERITVMRDKAEDRVNKVLRQLIIPIRVDIDRQTIIRIVKEHLLED